MKLKTRSFYGYRVGTGGSFEIHRNTPAELPPEELRTEIYVSIEGDEVGDFPGANPANPE